MPNWADLEKQYIMQTFRRLPVILDHGHGCMVSDTEGNSYLDLVAGIAVNVLGHAHPAVVKAITDQAQRLIHVSNLYYTTPQIELAELLVKHSCADQVFFCNSGAEANEGAFKLARKWGKLHRNGAYRIISTFNSFHGRTLATVAATGQAKYQDPFRPMPDGFSHVPYNDLDALKQATTDQTVAILLEPVQGESGVHPASQAYLEGARAWCDEQNLLLIFDEVQTGMGRTGHLFGYQGYRVEPDVFTLAKGLAGGVPIGAVLAKQRALAFGASDHASTFGGNPLACAAAVATLQTIIEDKLVDNAAQQGAYFADQLAELKSTMPQITDIRTRGLMLAFDLQTESAAAVVVKGLTHGVILNNTSANTIRMVPPLILSKADVDAAIDAIEATLKDV
jgi:acetylornithine aminotransferase/acetylornithine/N-succinyldiaminopimelate aminotransferase